MYPRTPAGQKKCASLTLIPVLLVSTLALCGCTPLQLRVAFHASTVADVGTTMKALDQGCIESNPLVGENPSDATLVGMGLLRTGLYEWGYHALEDDPEVTRKAYGWAMLVVSLIGPINNVIVMNDGC
jgi:hypothetical protein